tara:strand:- start:11843 stop:12076 length:234 start_codon:yes stop_codon:yes gene_type:complete
MKNVKLKIRHAHGELCSILLNWDNVSHVLERSEETSRNVFENPSPTGEVYAEVNMINGKILYVNHTIEEIEQELNEH